MTLIRSNQNLIDACALGDLEKVKYLVESGIDIHEDDDAPSRCALDNGYLEILKYLIEQGSNIYSYGNAPLKRAAYRGHLKIVHYLIEQGADIHTDYEILEVAIAGGHLQIVQYFREIAGPKWKCHTCLLKPVCMELCDDYDDYH